MPPISRRDDPDGLAPPASRRFDTLMPALVGLAGVLIGALVTSGISYLGNRAHRIADERTAKRLVANEISHDSYRLLFVSGYGFITGAMPQTLQWQTEAPTLARYIDAPTWSKVTKFYYGILNIQPSLSTRCVTTATRKIRDKHREDRQ